jgi:hypothetical protein
LGGEGVGIGVDNRAIDTIRHLTATLGGDIDDVVSTAAVQRVVVSLSIAATLGGIDDVICTAIVHGRIVGNSIAALSEGTTTRDDIPVRTASLRG